MKPEIKLFFDFEFTSLSPDAQLISLGIISEKIDTSIRLVDKSLIDKSLAENELSKFIYDNKLGQEIEGSTSKSFYAEFSDFDLNRCDDWVKDNVVGKLYLNPFKIFDTNKSVKEQTGKENMIGVRMIEFIERTNSKTNKDIVRFEDTCKDPNDLRVYHDDNGKYYGTIRGIKEALHCWLERFSEYNIQFVCDCGTFDWYWMLQLLAEWDMIDNIWVYGDDYKSGLPKLPSNISPVPEDLNDLIAHKKGISVREAFELNREDEVTVALRGNLHGNVMCEDGSTALKHNALWDAKVIKAIYEKLK